MLDFVCRVRRIMCMSTVVFFCIAWRKHWSGVLVYFSTQMTRLPPLSRITFGSSNVSWQGKAQMKTERFDQDTATSYRNNKFE